MAQAQLTSAYAAMSGGPRRECGKAVIQREVDMRFHRRAVLIGVLAALLAGAAAYAIIPVLAHFGSCWGCGW